MSHSGDACLYVLALHGGLLSEEELDARVGTAAEAGVSLEACLAEAEDVDPTRLRQLLAERKQLARRCGDCRSVSYVLPGQAETCPHCQGPLFRPRHTPKPPQRQQLAKVAAALDSARVARLNELPQRRPRRAAAAGVTLAAGVATARRPAATARAEVPSPLEEMTQQAIQLCKNLKRAGHVPRLVIAASAILVVAGLWSMFAGMLEGIEWHGSDPASVNHARARQCLRVVVITDPSRQDCLRFTQDVLLSSEVLEVAEDYVWQQDNAKGRIEPPDRSNDYAAAHMGTNRLPFVLVYDSNAKVLTGCLGAGDMTPAGFLALLEEAKQQRP